MPEQHAAALQCQQEISAFVGARMASFLAVPANADVYYALQRAPG